MIEEINKLDLMIEQFNQLMNDKTNNYSLF